MGDRGERRLTTIAVKQAGDGKIFDGRGLMLVKLGAAGKWIYRYSHLGRRREMGLGSWPAVSLAEARAARDRWAAELARGNDPVSAREAQRAAEKAERDKSDPTFAEMVDLVFEARKDGLRGGGTRGRWRSPLDQHVIPKIGKKRLSSLHQTDIRDALQPIWRKMPPTAEKAIQRTRIVIAEAQLMGFEADPFVVDAARRMLGEVRHVVRGIPATPWAELPALWDKLDPDTASGLCLRWIILTCVRADAARKARLAEIDGDVWTVPADRVKGLEGKAEDFRVPLSPAAQEIVQEARDAGADLLFPGQRGGAVTDRALELYLDRLYEVGRPHGFRSSFRTWAQDTGVSYDLAETALGHIVGGRVERAYARSDLLERRRPVMEAWAAFVTGEGAAEVIPIRHGR